MFLTVLWHRTQVTATDMLTVVTDTMVCTVRMVVTDEAVTVATEDTAVTVTADMVTMAITDATVVTDTTEETNISDITVTIAVITDINQSLKKRVIVKVIDSGAGAFTRSVLPRTATREDVVDKVLENTIRTEIRSKRMLRIF